MTCIQNCYEQRYVNYEYHECEILHTLFSRSSSNVLEQNPTSMRLNERLYPRISS
jgi:hypothetical protein